MTNNHKTHLLVETEVLCPYGSGVEIGGLLLALSDDTKIRQIGGIPQDKVEGNDNKKRTRRCIE